MRFFRLVKMRMLVRQTRAYAMVYALVNSGYILPMISDGVTDKINTVMETKKAYFVSHTTQRISTLAVNQFDHKKLKKKRLFYSTCTYAPVVVEFS